VCCTDGGLPIACFLLHALHVLCDFRVSTHELKLCSAVCRTTWHALYSRFLEYYAVVLLVLPLSASPNADTCLTSTVKELTAQLNHRDRL